MSLLQVKNLVVEFPNRHGVLRAIDDISFSIAPGEILGVVGESGAGKSLTGASIIGLLEPPGRVSSGEVWLEGRRIDNLPYEEMRKVRGRRIGAIFQDPLTSLNPLYSVGRQLIETIMTHLPVRFDLRDLLRRRVGQLGDFCLPATTQHNIGTTTSHVSCDRYRCGITRLSNDICFFGVEFRVQYVVFDTRFRQLI